MRTAAIIPTWRRSEALAGTLRRILECDPPPAEIWVHVDAGDPDTLAMLERDFGGGAVSWMTSDTTQGPGGGRNRLVDAASAEFLVSLDDDSWPLDSDFFAKAEAILDARPKAGLLAAAVSARGETPVPVRPELVPVSGFENCGCVFRRKAFQDTAGYLPLRYAYGMEETDVSFQLLDAGWEMFFAPELRVFHDTDLGHHGSAGVNAAQISNTGLLAFLRYPRSAWPLGALQVANRVIYALRIGRYRGIIRGLADLPKVCWRHRAVRRPIKSATLRSSRELRRAIGPRESGK